MALLEGVFFVVPLFLFCGALRGPVCTSCVLSRASLEYYVIYFASYPLKEGVDDKLLFLSLIFTCGCSD